MKLKLLTKKANLEKARKLTKEAAIKGAKLVVLPSFFNTSPFFLYYPMQRNKIIVKNQAERIPSMTSEYLSLMASESGVYIIAGPMIERAGPRLFLTTLVVAPNGEIIAKYRKLAISGLDEELGITYGKSAYVLNNLGRPIGVMAEDDIYYPEVARSLLLMGATLFITTLRIGEPIEKLKLMLQARSKECNVPILAVGGALEAMDKYIETPTMVVDPEKGIVEEMKDNIDNILLVEVLEKPENLREILYSALRAKNLSQQLCKAARENTVEDMIGRLNQ